MSGAIACPTCGNQVSAKAFDCPSCGHPMKKPKRGFFGVLFKWTFILFNVLMLVWLVSAAGAVSEATGNMASDAEKAGAVIGGTLGFGLLFALWVAGDVILGLFVLFTRPARR